MVPGAGMRMLEVNSGVLAVKAGRGLFTWRAGVCGLFKARRI